MEVPVDQIASRSHPFVAEGRAGGFAAADAGNASGFHQPLYTLATDPGAFIDQFGMDARSPIGLSGGSMDRLDANRQIRIGT
jgi:hypothetical protein